MDRMLDLCSKKENSTGDFSVDSTDSAGDTENGITSVTWGEKSFESTSSGIGESISSRIPVLDCPERIYTFF